MKVLYVDMKYDYGNPERGINQIGQLGFRKSFIDLGHEVTDFYYDEYLNDTEALQGKVLQIANDSRPDLIFFSLYKDQFRKDTLLELKSKYKTMNWFGDDTWRFDSFTVEYAPCFTYSVTTDKFSIPKYKILDTKVISSQWAAIKSDQSQREVGTYKYDISFVGGKHPVREWFVKEFRKAGLNVSTFGFGWPSGPVPLDGMFQIFSESKINLNLSNSNSMDARYLLSGLKPLYHSLRSKKNQSQVKARHFEISYFGGFQLSEYVLGLEDYLEIGKEVVVYKDVDEAIFMAKYYLENEEEREQIRLCSETKVLKDNTYQTRFLDILKQVDV